MTLAEHSDGTSSCVTPAWSKTIAVSRLPQFIRDNTEQILSEWEAFARALPVAGPKDIGTLRDHAKEMLSVIASDLETPETEQEQKEKAKGKLDADEAGPPSSAAQEHGASRAASGYTIAQMLSELRALRASVVRLWTRQLREVDARDLNDLIRLNEAIDQAVAESIAQYSKEIAASKDRFLAILGHDLRTPLGAILMSASFMLETGELTESHRSLVTRIATSARRMGQMVSDLLDFTNSQFGDGIPITRAEMDVSKPVRDVVAEIRTLYPQATVRVTLDGDLRGEWDSARLTQALTNLIGNAVQHGAKDAPIDVAAHGAVNDVTVSVQNEGPVIPEERLGTLFQAGTHGASASTNDDHFGLGLYIVERIAAAHGGSVDVRSSPADGTTFTLRLPRVRSTR